MYFLKHAISSETDGFWLIANYGSSCPSPRPATERARRMLVKSPRGFCVELLAGVRQHFRTTHQEDGGNDRTGEDQSDQVVERVIEGPSCPRHGCRSGSVSRSVPISRAKCALRLEVLCRTCIIYQMQRRAHAQRRVC